MKDRRKIAEIERIVLPYTYIGKNPYFIHLFLMCHSLAHRVNSPVCMFFFSSSPSLVYIIYEFDINSTHSGRMLIRVYGTDLCIYRINWLGFQFVTCYIHINCAPEYYNFYPIEKHKKLIDKRYNDDGDQAKVFLLEK